MSQTCVICISNGLNWSLPMHREIDGGQIGNL